MLKSRNTQLDLLRVVGSFMVILLHVQDALGFTNLYLITTKLIGSMFITIFIMVSGYLLINPWENADKTFSFYYSRIKRLTLPVIVWAVVYIIVYRENVLTAVSGLFNPINLLAGPYFHFYFVKLLVVLYAFTPIINVLYGKYKNLFNYLLPITLIFCVISLFYTNAAVFYVAAFSQYILGYLIKEKKDFRNIRFAYILAVFLITVATLVSLFWVELHYIRPFNVEYVITAFFLNPLMLVGSFCIFILFMRTKIVRFTNLIQKAGELSLHVYLMHLLFVTLFRGHVNTYLSIILIFVLCYFILFALDFLIRFYKKSNKVPFILIVLVIITFFVTLFVYYRYQNSKDTLQDAPKTVVTKNPFPTLQVTPTESSVPLSAIKLSNWRTYKGNQYTYQYPSEWESPNGNSQVTFSVYKNQTMGRECGDLLEHSDLYVDGIKSPYAVWSSIDCGRGKLSEIFLSFDKGNDHYAFDFVFAKGDEEAAKKIFIKIVNSFRFN